MRVWNQLALPRCRCLEYDVNGCVVQSASGCCSPHREVVGKLAFARADGDSFVTGCLNGGVGPDSVAPMRRVEPLVATFVAAALLSIILLSSTLLLAASAKNRSLEDHPKVPDQVAPSVRFIAEKLYFASTVNTAEAFPHTCNFADVGSVYSFVSGRAELERDRQTGRTRGEILERLEQIRRKMASLASGHVLKGLVLVGRVDRVPFNAQSEGTNKELAWDRVDWFEEWALGELKEIDGIEVAVERALRVQSDPLDVPSAEECPGDKLESDAPERRRHRSVDVFACWVPTPATLDA